MRFNLKLGSLLTVSGLALATALATATAAEGIASTPTAAPDRPAAAPGPDTVALRFYATRGDKARFEAELARLRALYPDWTPPSLNDPEADAEGQGEEQDLWDLFAADQIDALNGAIEQRRRDIPGWSPSGDLADKLAVKQARVEIQRLEKAGEYAKIVELFDAVEGRGYQDVELAWSYAQAQARLNRPARALTAYKRILETQQNPNVRRATIQKSLGNLRMGDIESLVSMSRNVEGANEFSPIAVDIIRRRIAAYLHDERVEAIPETELSVFETFARGASDASQPGLVAWYRYKTKAFDPALEWFRLALEKGGDATVAHGLAHTLRSLNRTRETEDVAYAWRNHLINNAILFIDILERDLTKPAPPPIETARLQRYAQVTLELTSGEGAQGLGWYAYNTCQFEAAYEWFQRAVAWSPKEATVYGLLMAAERTGKRERIVDIANRYDGMFPKVVEYVFPDGKWRPPTPCDIIKNDPTGKLHLLERAQAQAAQQQAGWQFEANAPRAMARPRAAFPKAVSPENPLRAASNGALTQNAAESDRAPAPNAPLVARRVLGAGAMPYEEFGFSLLPAIDGSTIAKGAHNAQTAGAGTIWATEQVEDARSTTGTSLFDLMSRDAPRVFETLRHAGRVPMPREVARSAPSASNAPNGRPLNFAPGMVSMETTGSIPDRDKRAGKRAPQAADRASRFELGAPMPEASGFTKSTGSAPK